MSVPVNGVVRRNGGGRLPDGTEVASYGSYEEALAALEVLASNDFEVEQVSVVGTDLYSVERIMGRVTWARAVSSAVMNGALWGAMIGIVLSINQGNTMVWVGACMLAGAFMTACLIPFLHTQAPTRFLLSIASGCRASRSHHREGCGRGSHS